MQTTFNKLEYTSSYQDGRKEGLTEEETERKKEKTPATFFIK